MRPALKTVLLLLIAPNLISLFISCDRNGEKKTKMEIYACSRVAEAGPVDNGIFNYPFDSLSYFRHLHEYQLYDGKKAGDSICVRSFTSRGIPDALIAEINRGFIPIDSHPWTPRAMVLIRQDKQVVDTFFLDRNFTWLVGGATYQNAILDSIIQQELKSDIGLSWFPLGVSPAVQFPCNFH
jgi:hypothetical protein